MDRSIRAVILTVLLILILPVIGLTDAKTGNVQVYLRRIVSDYPLEIDMNGAFTAGDGAVWFASGTHLMAAVQEGNIYLYGRDFTLNAGERVTFLRTETGEDSYLLLAGGTNQYAGDLTLTIQDGRIRPVLSINIEEYVRGVVPYELGDSFPLEALKAQAVAARTYALARAGKNVDYDVDDTTNDQVFRGRSALSPLSDRAVKETEGMIAVRDGKPAVCYYTASNGGWIEDGQNVWPVEDPEAYTYMPAHEDPYDLRNTSSPVRRYILPAVPGEDGLNTEIRTVLQTAAAGALSKPSAEVIPEQIRVDEITKVTLGEPMFADSKIIKNVNFAVRYSIRKVLEKKEVPVVTIEPTNMVPTPAPDAAGESPQEEPVRTETQYVFSDYEKAADELSLSVPFFGALERGMGLSINVTENEVLNLYQVDEGFVFETRRFGHGAGMSQRGAEQMARHSGKNYQDILSFYYPGLTLTKLDYTPEAREMEHAFMAVQPTPRPSPTPRPTLMPLTETKTQKGWYVAEVTNIDEDSSLNLRDAPSYSGEVRRRLYKYQRLMVESETADGWAKVHTDVIEGYVRTEFLQAVH